MKTILDAAGIRRIEASQLFQITRATLYSWLRGYGRPKSGFCFLHAEAQCLKINKAVERGRLPLPEDVKGKRRLRYIREILKRH
jgi:hypothetical protein